jgi:serine/threonine-protein kinase HipA
MCQLTETLTADKYRSSMEKIGKHIALYSSRPGLTPFTFLNWLCFLFLTGNADMHLKNFSLLTTRQNNIILSPAYDLLCTKLALPEDPEEMALTLNGKKRKLKRSDFDTLAKSLKIPDKALKNTYNRLAINSKTLFHSWKFSFLPEERKWITNAFKGAG